MSQARLRSSIKIRYLLASAFTLSISDIRVTSLSIKLEEEKKKEEKEKGSFYLPHSEIRGNIVHADFALRLQCIPITDKAVVASSLWDQKYSSVSE